jgi:excisionase family DNA binding protein
MNYSRPNHQIEPTFLDLASASAYTGGGLSVRTLRRFIAKGHLPAFRPGGPGGKVLVRKTDLEALIESCSIFFELDSLASEIVADMSREKQFKC